MYFVKHMDRTLIIHVAAGAVLTQNKILEMSKEVMAFHVSASLELCIMQPTYPKEIKTSKHNV